MTMKATANWKCNNCGATATTKATGYGWMAPPKGWGSGASLRLVAGTRRRRTGDLCAACNRAAIAAAKAALAKRKKKK